VYTAASANANPSFSQAFSLAAGDTLDVAVAPRADGDFTCGSTPVTFVVTRR